MGLNLLIIKLKNSETILLISYKILLITNILLSNLFIQIPVIIAKNTIESTLEFVVKTLKKLLGIASKIIIKGFELESVIWDEAILLISTLNIPKLWAISPNTQANANANKYIIKKLDTVLPAILPNFLLSFIWHIERAIEENIKGTITSCKAFIKSWPKI